MGARIEGGRFLPLDGLRTVLVTGVLLNHLEWWASGPEDQVFVAGWLPVDGFFVLSGFLIANNLFGELDRRDGIDPWRFLARRLARLYPALLLVLAAVALVTVAADGLPFAAVWPSLWTSATYTGNLAYLTGDAIVWHVGPLWSLGVELQFYLVLPIVMIVLTRLRAPRVAWVALFVAVAVGSAVWRASLGFEAYPKSYMFPLARADALMGGVLLAMGWRSGRLATVPKPALRLAAAGGAVTLVVVYFTIGDHENAAYRWAIATAALSSVAVVAWLVREPGSFAGRILSSSPLVALGHRAYSAYLWHQLVFIFLRTTVEVEGWALVASGLALTWTLADLTYRFVERPVISWSHRRFTAARPRVAERDGLLYGSLHH